MLVDADAPPQLREEALRLVNLFASEASGRSYLLAKPDLVVSLCKLLTLENADSTARQNALGTLQKLSLRRQPQNTMIDMDVISWLVQQLADIDSLSAYSVQYGTALLMNLSLRTAGKAKCAAPELDVLSVLSQLMESDSVQVRARRERGPISARPRPRPRPDLGPLSALIPARSPPRRCGRTSTAPCTRCWSAAA